MTIEITEFRCPTCGHVLGEEEYTQAHQEVNKIVTERVRKAEESKDLKHGQEIHKLQEQHIKEIQEMKQAEESEIQNRVHQALREERATVELKHIRDLEEKDRQIEAARLEGRHEGTADIEEKIHTAVAENEEKHMQRASQFELQFRRADQRNRELMDHVEKLQKTLENVPAEFRGTAFENNIANRLRNAFKDDDIQEKENGQEMADIVQNIVTDSGERISTPIVYDTKTADTVTPKDIEKAKKYKTIHNTNYCIIVTKKGIKPKDCGIEPSNLIGEREGIFLVHPSTVVGIVRLMRSWVIKDAKQIKINNGAESKYRKIYDYITSPERFRKIEEKMLTKSKLDQLQKNEEEYHKRKWKQWKEGIQNWYDSDMDDQKKMEDIAEENADIDDNKMRTQTSNDLKDDMDKMEEE